MVRDAGGGRGWVDVHVHHSYITRTSLVHHSYITRTSPVHRPYIARTSLVHHLYITCTSCVGEGCRGAGTWRSRARESGKSESRKGGAAESERGKAERSGNVGKRSSHKGVPLTITPPLEKHRPDAWIGREIGRKGIEPKVIVQMHRGAAGLLWWNSATFSGALSTFSEYSQVFPSTP